MSDPAHSTPAGAQGLSATNTSAVDARKSVVDNRRSRWTTTESVFDDRKSRRDSHQLSRRDSQFISEVLHAGLSSNFVGTAPSPAPADDASSPASDPGSGAATAPEPPSSWESFRARATPSDPLVTSAKLIQLLDRIVIHPSSKLKASWDLIMLGFVLYSTVVVPLEVVYQVEIWEEIEPGLDGLFAVDILVQSCSGFFILGGSRFPVLQWPRVVRNYAQTWLLFDLLAAIPFDAMVPEGSEGVRAIALLKTVRLVKVRRLLKKYNNRSFGPLLRVVVILAFWLLCAHWVACGFFVIGWSTCNVYSGQPQSVNGSCATRATQCHGNWITRYWPEITDMCVAGDAPNDVAETFGLTIFSIHSLALGWSLATMSSMGYGQLPVAISDSDYMYAFATQVLGSCSMATGIELAAYKLYVHQTAVHDLEICSLSAHSLTCAVAAALFSNFAQLMNKNDAGAARYQEQLQKINELDRLYKLPPESKRMLLDYHELIFSAYNGFDLKEVATTFPEHLQGRIFYQLHRDLLSQVPMFANCEAGFIQQLALKLGTQVVLAGDYVLRKNELGELMYFLKLGIVDIGNPDMSVVYVTKLANSYFGEIAVFCNTRRTASARARVDSIMYTLSKTSFESVAIRFPQSYDNVYRVSEDLLRKVTVANTQTDRRCSTIETDLSVSPMSTARRLARLSDGGTTVTDDVDTSPASTPRRPARFSEGGPTHMHVIDEKIVATTPRRLSRFSQGGPSRMTVTDKALSLRPKAASDSVVKEARFRVGNPIAFVPKKPNRLTMVHTTTLASMPPSSLAPLYSQQALAMINEAVMPVVHSTNESMASLNSELLPVLNATQQKVADIQRHLQRIRTRQANPWANAPNTPHLV